MTTDMTELSRRGRAAYWVVAALAWAGVAATLIITAFDGYAPAWSSPQPLILPRLRISHVIPPALLQVLKIGR